jgi:dephospho-CoA kinase
MVPAEAAAAGPLTIGVTGSLGCGKSTICGMLREEGERRWGAGSVETIDADALARQAVEPGEPALARIAETLGSEWIGPDGRLRRKELAGHVFGNRAALRELEAIVHPVVRAATVEAMKRAAGGRLIVLDVPLLLEVGMQSMVDRVVVVTAGEARRLGRLRVRQGMREAEAVARMGRQMPQARKAALADAVIDNDGDLESTRRQTAAVLEKWTAGRAPGNAGAGRGTTGGNLV